MNNNLSKNFFADHFDLEQKEKTRDIKRILSGKMPYIPRYNGESLTITEIEQFANTNGIEFNSEELLSLPSQAQYFKIEYIYDEYRDAGADIETLKEWMICEGIAENPNRPTRTEATNIIGLYSTGFLTAQCRKLNKMVVA